MVDNEAGSQVFIGATKREQAKIIFEESQRMLRQSPHIAKQAVIHRDNIAFPETNSFIRPVSSDKSYDGLNPHCCVLDEIHAMRENVHSDFIDTMLTGGASRTQPLVVMVTTAGNDKSHIYHEFANESRGVLSGDIFDPSLFAMIFELDKDDDPFAETFELDTLAKANPNYEISVKAEYLQQQLREAKNKPQSRSRFIRYHGNRCVSSVEEAITADIWDAAAGPLDDWKQSHGIGAGVDLGGQDDLAAYALSAKFKINEDSEGRPVYRHEVFSRCFISANTKARDLSKQPYAQWIAEGKLIVCDYAISTLKQYLLEDCQAHGVEYIAYDPYQAQQFAEDLESEGLKPVKDGAEPNTL